MRLNLTIPTALGDLQVYADPSKLNKADKLIQSVPKILTESYNIAGYRFAERIARMAKTCLSRGMPPRGSGVSWPPHSVNTVKRLGEHTLLNWSGQYKNAIRVGRRGKHIYAGVPSGLKKTRPDHRPGRLTLSQVAKILEYGTDDGRIPERPLWNPLWEVVGGKAKFKEELVQEIRKQIRKYS